MKNWVKVAIVLALIAFIFANPLTRAIVIFILPLGSGVDDFIEMIALVLLAILLLVKIKKNWRKIIEWFNS